MAKTAAKTPPRPYYTTYPAPQWCWFDVAVYAEFPPRIGNLPTALFDRLAGGKPLSRYRRYESEQAARDDYAAAVAAVAAPANPVLSGGPDG